jgi:hypothetical protein
MSSEVMVWMKIKAKTYDKKSKEGFKAFVELLKHNTVNIEDPMTGSTLAYLSEKDNEELFKKTSQLEENSQLTLMGHGDSWSFENAQTLVELLTEHKEAVIKDMGYRKKDRDKLGKLLDIIEKSDLKLEFTNIIFRKEDIDILEGFDEFVWCSYKGCKVPAEYNFKLLENGRRKGYDEFPASFPLKEGDIPYCQEHFNKMLEKDQDGN